MYRLSNQKYKNYILNPASIEFLNELAVKVLPSFDYSLKARYEQNVQNFRNDTEFIREKKWKIDHVPLQLRKRHVEITGPANNKRMMINACNSGANGYMIDLEDSMSPSIENVLQGHDNIYKLVRRQLSDVKYKSGTNIIEKEYKLKTVMPTLFVRHRGLHMKEKMLENGLNQPIPATIFDVGLHLFHNAEYMLKDNSGPFFYSPKVENFEDALFLTVLFDSAEKLLGIHKGSIKTTLLIETFPAIFQTEEIIYALKDYIVGLNCGRWDYLFSMLKETDNILPDRSALHMEQPFLEAYVHQIVKSCKKRGIVPMGGMSAILPTRDEQQNRINMEKIMQDKRLEISRGVHGAWVAHPGLVKPIQKLFEATSSSEFSPRELSKHDFERVIFTETPDLSKNINIALQYISTWLSGNGAVAIHNVMEDLATAEISLHQVKQHYRNNFVSKEELGQMIELECKNLENLNENTKTVMYQYIFENYGWLSDLFIQKKPIHFKPIKFGNDIIHKLSGSGHKTGIELTKHRGQFLREFLENGNTYKFLGTSNGISAVNVVAGGDGVVGPYAGGWQTNAMKNRLGMLLPDTLHVAPEEASTCANEINQHLFQADCVQHAQGKDNVNYQDIALLADMEQGWNTPEKIRMSVKLAIQNGINVIHIEDQGEKKRCGHLGDKELNTIDDYCMLLRSANLAAQELLGPGQNDVIFVARTDAYSAKRIVNSSNLYREDCLEHNFIDWKRGTSEDGKYLYLKQGTNPKTGNSYGLDLSIVRATHVVRHGLASHVWMETPDADLTVARNFIQGVNSNLEQEGLRAFGLYNHSPSFDWDLKFFSEAQETTNELLSYIMENDDNYIYVNVVNFLNNDTFYGDFNMDTHSIEKICLHIADYLQGEDLWQEQKNILFKNLMSNQCMNIELCANLENMEYNPVDKITDIIVENRLKQFSEQLSSFGYNLHLITLPEFHVTAYQMHQLSQNFSKDGIHAFVRQVQRPERLLHERDETYTYYKHQTATGTGLEAIFSKAVGSSNVNTLDDSTESDDLKKRSS
jgi:malate synthase